MGAIIFGSLITILGFISLAIGISILAIKEEDEEGNAIVGCINKEMIALIYFLWSALYAWLLGLGVAGYLNRACPKFHEFASRMDFFVKI